MYFLRQYYQSLDGGHFDMQLEGLAKNYSELQTVNCLPAVLGLQEKSSN